VSATPASAIAAVAAVVLVAGAACRPDPSTARGTAERFLDAHYVAIDLNEALPYTSGLARQKVQKELELVRGVSIDDTTLKPVVHYTLLEEHPDDADAAKFLYRGDIAVEGADALVRQWLVTVRREPDGWRVTNYQEYAE
jgi:hypothetical protein